MTLNEILTHLHLLMKEKNHRKLSGSYEILAYREEANKLKQHCRFVLEGKHGKSP